MRWTTTYKTYRAIRKELKITCVKNYFSNMATGRTVSASFLINLDKQVIELCSTIAETIQNSIQDKDLQKEFKKQFGKISYTRDGGVKAHNRI